MADKPTSRPAFGSAAKANDKPADLTPEEKVMADELEKLAAQDAEATKSVPARAVPDDVTPAPTSQPATVAATTTPVGQVSAERDKIALDQLKAPEPDPKRQTQQTQADGTSVPANARSLNPQPPQAARPEPAQKDEGEYTDPDSVPPNPNAEMHPNMRQPEPTIPRADLLPANSHQVYPELHFGTTPTDPDIRHREDNKEVTTAQQTAEMARRRSSAFPEERVPLDEPIKEMDDVRRRIASNPPPPQSPERPKATGTLTNVVSNQQYKIRHEGETAWWWQRKYDTIPVVTVEGSVEDVLGVPGGDRRLLGHHLQDAFNNRIGMLPANSPILRDHDKNLYVATVFGRRELVHAAELESLNEKAPAA